MNNLTSHFKIFEIKRINYRKDINGLRAIAVLAVVFFHAGVPVFSSGWLGVDIFFVLSGYLISNIIVSELNVDKFSFKKFYIRRVRRIIPALLSTILICIPFVYWLFTPKATIEFINSTIASMFFYANYFFQNLDFYNTEPTRFMPLLHTWSLAVEEQFYLLFPLFCFLVYRFFKKYFFSFLLTAFLFSIFFNSTTGDLIKFYQIAFRGWELLFGAIIMVINNRYSIKYINYLGFFIIAYSITSFGNEMLILNSLEPKLLVNLGTACVLLSKNNDLFSKIFLNNSFSQNIGNLSYSLYLFHQPFFAFILFYFKKNNLYLNFYLEVIIIFSLLILSFLNWKFVEIKFQNFKTNYLIIGLSSFIFLILSFSTIGISTNGYESRFSDIPDEILFYSSNPIIFPTTEELDNFNNHCDNKNKRNLYIVGDSYAYTFSYTLITEYKDLSCEYNLKIFSGDAGRCILSQQSDTVGYIGWCEEAQFNKFIESVKTDKPIILAIGRFDTWITKSKGGSEIKCQNCNYLDVFLDRLFIIAEKSQQLKLISPIPTYPIKVTESYLYKQTPLNQDITRSYSDWLSYINFFDIFLNKVDSNNFIKFSSDDIFCDKSLDKCFASKRGDIFYSDSNHLTKKGSSLLIEAIFKDLNNN